MLVRHMARQLVTAWATHPAFNWSDKKLNGIWVAKFEMTDTRTEPTVKPNSRSNVLEDVGILYTMAKNIGYSDSQNIGGLSITGIKSNYHSLAQATSHLIKNTEWGRHRIWRLANTVLGITE